MSTLLAVTAHPDDESFGPGGTLARCAARGVRVVLLCATRGEAGKAGDPPLCTREELPRVREAELRRAAAVLGIAEVRFLDYVDGRVDRVDAGEAVERIARHMEELGPETVLTLPPGGVSGHPDHRAVSRFATRAFFLARRRRGDGLPGALYYWTLAAERIRDITGTAPFHPLDAARTAVVDVTASLDRKIEAVACHRTQHLSVERVFRGFPPEVRAVLSRESFYRYYPPHGPAEPPQTEIIPV